MSIDCTVCNCLKQFSGDQESFQYAVLKLLCDLQSGGGTPTTGTRYDWETLCDPNNNNAPVLVRTEYLTDGTINPVSAFNADGTPFAGALTSLVACAGSTTPTDNEVEALVIRLDGDSANLTATPFLNFLGGTPGQEYTLNFPFRSFACAWLRETAQDSDFEINDIGYRAGVSAGSAGYPTILPQLENDGGIELHTDPYTFRALPGAKVEIIITRDK